MTTETTATPPTMNIDVFSRPAMKEAERILSNIVPKDSYESDRLKRKHAFNLNESANAIESVLVTLGVYPTTKAAEEGCFHLDVAKNSLEIHGEDHETVLNTLSINEYPTLAPLIADIKEKTESLKAEASALQTEFNTVHAETWNMVYADLVAMGIFPTVEEAKKYKYTIAGGRFLRYTETKTRLAQMMSEIMGDIDL